MRFLHACRCYLRPSMPRRHLRRGRPHWSPHVASESGQSRGPRLSAHRRNIRKMKVLREAILPELRGVVSFRRVAARIGQRCRKSAGSSESLSRCTTMTTSRHISTHVMRARRCRCGSRTELSSVTSHHGNVGWCSSGGHFIEASYSRTGTCWQQVKIREELRPWRKHERRHRSSLCP